MTKALALIVDDEKDIGELVKLTLKKMEIDAIAVLSITEAKQALREHQFTFCLTDMRLPDGNGLDLVEFAQIYFPHVPIAVITAHGKVECAVDALKAGAFDFVCKPVQLDMLRTLVYAALKLSKQPQSSWKSIPTSLLGESEAMVNLREKIVKVSRQQAPILIVGELGTGAESVARTIHSQSARFDKAFVVLNCSSVAKHELERELFGFVKNSFVDAIFDKKGCFEHANGGTLYLSDVDALQIDTQIKLLNAIQDKVVKPIGSHLEISCNVRIIVSAHNDLQDMVTQGKFRQDLLYRINVVVLPIPNLCEHLDDLPVIANEVVKKLAHANDKAYIKLSQESLEKLTQYNYPGNLFELENILERAIALCEGENIQPDDIELHEDIKLPTPEPAEHSWIRFKPGEQENLEDYLEVIEKQAIIDALEKTKWNKTKAAKLLGISFRAMRYRLKKLELE